MLARIKAIAETTHHRYGSRRLTTQLQEEGYHAGRFTVRRVMQHAGVSVAGRHRCQPGGAAGAGVRPG